MIYFNDFRNRTPWYTDELYAQMNAVNDQEQLFENGILSKLIFFSKNL